jgi:hypothetical protein
MNIGSSALPRVAYKPVDFVALGLRLFEFSGCEVRPVA